MKKSLITCLVALSGAALASQAHAGETPAAPAQPAMSMAHAGHGHGAVGQAHEARPAGADAKASTTLAVSGCWIRSLPAPAPSAAYFTVKNSGGGQARLQSASSPAYGMVMLHQTTQKDGMSRMSATQDIAIPAGGQLEFKPGGYHAMLEDAATAPAIGSKVAMDFLFDTGEKATAECEVKAANTKSPMSH